MDAERTTATTEAVEKRSLAQHAVEAYVGGGAATAGGLTVKLGVDAIKAKLSPPQEPPAPHVIPAPGFDHQQ